MKIEMIPKVRSLLNYASALDLSNFSVCPAETTYLTFLQYLNSESLKESCEGYTSNTIATTENFVIAYKVKDELYVVIRLNKNTFLVKESVQELPKRKGFEVFWNMHGFILDQSKKYKIKNYKSYYI